MRQAIRCSRGIIGLVGVCLAQPASAQTEPAIWKGVYRAEQAERGQAVITTHCVRCHGDQRPLSGDLFMIHWEGHTVARLWRKIREQMPVNQVATVSEGDKLDALAFILQLNGFPAGQSDVSGELASLGPLQILPREGPRPLRTGMAGEAVGCLTKGGGSVWQLTKATEPIASAVDLFESDLKAAAAAPLGASTFSCCIRRATQSRTAARKCT